MPDIRIGDTIPPDLLLVGTVTALFRDLHEKDDPNVPCLRFEVKGSFLTVDEASAVYNGGEVGRRTKVGVTMYPDRRVSRGEQELALGKQLRKARDLVAGFAKSREQMYLDVSGLRLENGLSKGGAVRLRGLQDGSKTGALRGMTVGSGVGDAGVLGSGTSKLAAALINQPRLPKTSAGPVPIHSRVAASGVLEPPRASRPLQKISALTFRSSSTSASAQASHSTSSGSSSSRSAPVQINIPTTRKPAAISAKRRRSNSPIADPFQLVSPPAKRPAAETKSKKHISISQEPALFAENRSPPLRHRFLPASNSTQADSIQSFSFDGPAATPQQTPSGGVPTGEGGAGLVQRSQVSSRVELLDESRPSIGYEKTRHASLSPPRPIETIPESASFDDEAFYDQDLLDMIVKEEEEAAMQRQRQERQKQTAEAAEIERLKARLRELEGQTDASGLVKKTPPSPPSSNTLYWGGMSEDSLDAEDDARSPGRQRRSDVSASLRGRKGPSISTDLGLDYASIDERQRHAAASDRLPARSTVDVSPSPPGSPPRQIAHTTQATVDRQYAASRTVQLPANAAAGPSRGRAFSISRSAANGSTAVERDDEQSRPYRPSETSVVAPSERSTISLADLKRPFTVPSSPNGDRPVTYTPLKNLGSYGPANVIGVVVSSQAATRTDGEENDWVGNLVITDPSLFDARDMSNMDALTAFKTADDDLPITIFRHEQVQLPPRLAMGSVFLIQDLRLQLWQNKPKGQSASKKVAPCCWLTGSGGEVLYPLRSGTGAGAYRVTSEEEARMQALARWYENLGLPRADTGQAVGLSTVGRTAKSMPLCDLRNESFADITCKVLHVEMSGADRFAQIYVTDGTKSTAPHTWRNWHGIDRQIGGPSGSAAHAPIPLEAVYSLHIMQALPEAEALLLQPGNVLDVRNVRCALYEGQLEMMWSELPTEEQSARGWRRRKLRLVERGDECMRLMDQRIRALQADPSADTNSNLQRPAGAYTDRHASRSRSPVKPDKTYDTPMDLRQGQYAAAAAAAKMSSRLPQAVPVSASIMTTFTDTLLYPYSTLSDILDNQKVPNRYNVQARVKSIHPANPIAGGGKGGKGGNGEGGLVVKVCRPCERTFNDTYCKSCNDTTLSRASCQYRFIALLEPPPSPSNPDPEITSNDTPTNLLPVMIADEEAAAFLPALPPLTPLTSHNEIRTIERQIADCSKETYSLLLGSKMDGERVRPAIRWSVESYTARRRQHGQGKKGKGRDRDKGKAAEGEREGERERGRGEGGEGADEGVVAFRVFGMERK